MNANLTNNKLNNFTFKSKNLNPPKNHIKQQNGHRLDVGGILMAHQIHFLTEFAANLSNLHFPVAFPASPTPSGTLQFVVLSPVCGAWHRGFDQIFVVFAEEMLILGMGQLWVANYYFYINIKFF